MGKKIIVDPAKLKTEYAQYLTDSASVYHAAQDEITRAAGKLTN